MRSPNEIAKEEKAIGTLVELTNVFEGIASMRIAQFNNQVLKSTALFNDLWAISSLITVENLLHFGRSVA